MMVKEYITSLHNHTRIDFIALKETPKAVLMKIKHVESNHVKDLLNYYGADIMEPIEVWIPKSWLRMRDNKDDIWIWKQGLMKNLEALAKKRLANHEKIKKKSTKIKIDPDMIIPEGVTIH